MGLTTVSTSIEIIRVKTISEIRLRLLIIVASLIQGDSNYQPYVWQMDVSPLDHSRSRSGIMTTDGEKGEGRTVRL